MMHGIGWFMVGWCAADAVRFRFPELSIVPMIALQVATALSIFAILHV